MRRWPPKKKREREKKKRVHVQVHFSLVHCCVGKRLDDKPSGLRVTGACPSGPLRASAVPVRTVAGVTVAGSAVVRCGGVAGGRREEAAGRDSQGPVRREVLVLMEAGVGGAGMLMECGPYEVGEAPGCQEGVFHAWCAGLWNILPSVLIGERMHARVSPPPVQSCRQATFSCFCIVLSTPAMAISAGRVPARCVLSSTASPREGAMSPKEQDAPGSGRIGWMVPTAHRSDACRQTHCQKHKGATFKTHACAAMWKMADRF